jgi:DNA-binding beta-propeller fold protein YncE
MKWALSLAFACLASGAFSQGTSPLLFVTNNTSGSVSVFTRGTDGSLSFVGLYPVGTNPQDCGLTLDGRNLVVINAGQQTTEEVHTFVVNANGACLYSCRPAQWATVHCRSQ